MTNKIKIYGLKPVIKGLAYVIVFLMAFAYFLGGNGTQTGFAHFISTPLAEFLFDHKILIFLCVLLVMLIFAKFRRVRTWTAGFVILSLIILAVWHKGLFRSLSTLSRMASKVATLSGTTRYKLVSTVLFIIAAYLIFSSSSAYLIPPGMAILLLLLIFHFAGRFYSLSKPTRFFLRLKDSIDKHWDEILARELPKMLREWKCLDPSNVEYAVKRKEAIGSLWFYNRLFFRLGNYIGKMESNRLLVGYFILATGWAFILTVTVFAIEYLALDKITPGSFQGVIESSFGQFVYFSFTVITTTGFGDIVPMTGWARFLSSFEVLYGILIAIILFLVFTTVTVDRYRKSLDDLAYNLLRKAEETKSLLEAEDRRSINEIVPELLNSEEEIKPGSLSYRFFKIDEEESTQDLLQ